MIFFGTVYFLYFSERANFSFYFFLFFLWRVYCKHGDVQRIGIGCVSRKGTEALDGTAIELRLYLWARLYCRGSAALQWASPLQALGLHLLWIPLIYHLDTAYIPMGPAVIVFFTTGTRAILLSLNFLSSSGFCLFCLEVGIRRTLVPGLMVLRWRLEVSCPHHRGSTALLWAEGTSLVMLSISIFRT